MEPYYEKDGIRIVCGDTLETLKQMPSDFVDLVMTSPPYFNLRNYNVDGQIGLENSFQEYLDKMMVIFAEVKRVLKLIGQFWLNMGDSFGGLPAGNKSISKADIGKDGYYARVMKRGQGAKSFILATDSQRMFSGEMNNSRLKQTTNSKCMLMQPERMAIRMIDEQGWILRNKIKWCKQVYLYKQKKTVGSVMPSSVKDRFNESGEELYFFVKSKRYYSNLDAVRIPCFEPNNERPRIGQNQFQNNWSFKENRPYGIVRERKFGYNTEYPEARNKFNYRVRDAEKKAGQPQFKATKEEIENYGKADHRGPNDKTAKNYGLKNYQGKFVGNPNVEMFNSPRAKTQRVKYDISERQKELKNKGALPVNQRVQGFYDTFGGKTNPAGRNIPTIWQIGTEPHNFKTEFGLKVDHFATFPQALCEIPILFGTPKGGIVLDIFAGSFTTCLVAKKLGRKAIGIDLNEKYCEIAKRRLETIQSILL